MQRINQGPAFVSRCSGACIQTGRRQGQAWQRAEATLLDGQPERLSVLSAEFGVVASVHAPSLYSPAVPDADLIDNGNPFSNT